MTSVDPRRLRPRGLTVTARQALRTAALVLLLLFLLVAFLIGGGTNGAFRDINEAVDADTRLLMGIARTQGTPAVAHRIEERLAFEPTDHPRAGYLLTSAAGERLAGNIPPQLVVATPQLQLLLLKGQSRGYGRTDRGFGRATTLPDGARLVVMRSTLRTEALVKRLSGAFGMGGLAVVGLTGLGAWLSTRRLQKRLDAFDDAFDQVEAGDVGVRVPEDRGRDELSVLTRDVNGMLAQFERLLASQRKITDQTAHEIRTPLMHLDTTLVRAIAACDAKDADLLNEGRAEIRTVVALLDGLLDIARLEAMQGEARGLNELDLTSLVQEMAELYAASFDEAGLVLETRIAPQVALFGDAMLTTRMIANLLDNAIKYVPSPGRVRLVLEAGPRIVVEDDGPGVPADMAQWVFSRYARLEGEGAPGHGLGLALVRAIAERQGLIARVEDAGPGARFVVEPARA